MFSFLQVAPMILSPLNEPFAIVAPTPMKMSGEFL